MNKILTVPLPIVNMAQANKLTNDEIVDVLDALESKKLAELDDEILDIKEAAEKLMDGDQYTKVGRLKTLKPNITYKTPGGHLYTTDSLGRIDSVEGTLELVTGKRNSYAQRVAGRVDRLPDDQGGHLIASIFNGSGDLDNLVPMNGNLNQGVWKSMENTWGEMLKGGKEVKVLIDAVYDGASMRPTEFMVEYFIDGIRHEKIYQNIAGGGL